MLHILSGGTPHGSNEYIGKVIKSVTISDNEFHIVFSDGKHIKIWDDGQSCCEHRYMTTDDDVQSIVGKTLVDISQKNVESKSAEYGDDHEMAFVEILTNDGSVTIVNHNEHNGYYGGFGLSIDEV